MEANSNKIFSCLCDRVFTNQQDHLELSNRQQDLLEAIMTIGNLCRSIIIVSVAFMSLSGCAELLDGPFNQGKNMVPELLYANNGSDFVTYWDEESKSYKTYDQTKNELLAQAVFELEEEDPGQDFIVAGASIAPATILDEDEMLIQSEQGCVACHES
jgi:hypothetical protein